MAQRKRQRAVPATVTLSLTVEDVDDLVRVAGYYERSMGFMRHVVRLTSARAIRQRFRFVAEESRWLTVFAEATRADMRGSETEVDFTPRALIAFWGRALSSLQSKRSRRRMTPTQLAQRELLAGKLERAAARLLLDKPGVMAEELRTRRASEVTWMRERLEGGSGT
jgi:hypothetical protein